MGVGVPPRTALRTLVFERSWPGGTSHREWSPRQCPERALSRSPECPRRGGLAPRRVPWSF